MPELPEVETVRRVLSDNLIGLKITDIDVRYPKMIDNDLEYFYSNVINKEIVDIKRLGKYLIFILNDGAIISHLRMEGKYFYVNDDSIDNKHVHFIFRLSNGYSLMYQDVRKFGRIEYKKIDELYNTKPLSILGVDPILNNKIEINDIYDRIINKTIPIKSTLLEQSIICGLGNIYVDEVLHKSGVLPSRLSNTITLDEVRLIIEASIEILTKAIAFKGTTIRSYTSSLGIKGEYQQFLNIHTKNICAICSTNVSKMKIGGRTTYYCSKCQR